MPQEQVICAFRACLSHPVELTINGNIHEALQACHCELRGFNSEIVGASIVDDAALRSLLDYQPLVVIVPRSSGDEFVVRAYRALAGQTTVMVAEIIEGRSTANFMAGILNDVTPLIVYRHSNPPVPAAPS